MVRLKQCENVQDTKIEYASSRENIVVHGEDVEDVEKFTYLGATVDKDSEGSKDIMHRLHKARDAFQRLRRAWAAKGIGR